MAVRQAKRLTGTRPGWKRSRVRRATTRRSLLLVLPALGLVVAFVVTEHLFYFPLTPLSLDRAGETRLPPAAGRLRLLFVGDTLLGDRAAGTLAHRGHDYPFDATRALIRGADLAVGNLEGPIALGGAQAEKRWSYRMSPLAAVALARAGFDAMDLGNNHVGDRGEAGLRETVAWLDLAGVRSFGAGMTEVEAHRPAVVDVRGVRVALLGYLAPYLEGPGGRYSLDHLCWGPGRGGAARGAPRLIARDVRAARAAADLVLVSIHLGDRYQEKPTASERALCRGAIDAGADAVVGHGSHILGPIEVHRGRPILYGVGNFAFGSMNVFARFSLVALLEVDSDRRRIAGLQVLPLFTMNSNPWIWFQPKILDGAQGRRVLRRVLALSRPSAAGLRLARGPTRLVWDP